MRRTALLAEEKRRAQEALRRTVRQQRTNLRELGFEFRLSIFF